MSYWACVCLQRHRERFAINCLAIAGFDKVYHPMARVPRIVRGRRIVIHEPLFGGYCFAWVAAQWHSLRWCPGVIGMILDGGRPAAVPAHIIDEIRRRENGDGLVDLVPQSQRFRKGARVKVVHGALKGIDGIFEGATSHDRARILLALLGRVELPQSDIMVIE